MEDCTRCGGFVPPSNTTCPHCDAALAAAPKKSRVLVGATKLAVGALTAVTLMACYGGGPRDWEPVDCTDNDNDGVCADVDCDDTNPSVGADCPSCVDNDGDGYCAFEDCDDVDPSRAVDCCQDYDADGVCAAQDCDDYDASTWEWCDDICAFAETAVLGSTLGDTRDGQEQTSTCGGGTTEVVYELTVAGTPGELQYVTAAVEAETAHYLAARAACLNAGDIACGNIEPRIELLALPGDPLWFIVEAADEIARGPFELVIDVQPLVCGDGIQVGPEGCDDGNQLPGDGCDETCQPEEGT